MGTTTRGPGTMLPVAEWQRLLAREDLPEELAYQIAEELSLFEAFDDVEGIELNIDVDLSAYGVQ